MHPNETLLDLLIELQALDRVPRMGYAMRGVGDPESVTEHCWHVLFLVWALAPRVTGVDTAKAIEIALVHDLAELRIGDLPRTAAHYLDRGAKKKAESAALAEILAPLGERTLALFKEYEAATTAEAKLVKACDKLQLMLKVAVYERWGEGDLGEFWDNPDNFPQLGIEAVDRMVGELRSQRSRVISRSKPEAR